MVRLANISGKDAARAFERAGWTAGGQVGSHPVLVKSGIRVNLSIPQHKELSIGTLRSLIRHAGLTVDEFLDLCKWSLRFFSHVGGRFRGNPDRAAILALSREQENPAGLAWHEAMLRPDSNSRPGEMPSLE